MINHKLIKIRNNLNKKILKMYKQILVLAIIFCVRADILLEDFSNPKYTWK